MGVGLIEYLEDADSLWKAEKCPWCRGDLYRIRGEKGTIKAEYICLNSCSSTENYE